MTDLALGANPTSLHEELDAIVLAGGRGRRIGGADKAELLVDGQRLVDRAVAAAVGGGAKRIVVVGPNHAGSQGVLVVREVPAFGGPLAAVATALPLLESPWILLLACDLVHPQEIVTVLQAALSEMSETAEFDGVMMTDDAGNRQWLAGIYRRDHLTHSIVELTAEFEGDFTNKPVRLLFQDARIIELEHDAQLTKDIDQIEDLVRAQKL